MERLVPALAVVAYVTAVLGLLLTLFLLGEGMRVGLAHAREPDDLVYAWVALLMVAGGAYVFVWHYGTLDLTRREAEKAMWSGCPRWMKWTAWAVCLVGAVMFFGQFALEQLGRLPTSDGRRIPTFVIGGFGLIWFTAAVAQTYSVLHRRQTAEPTLVSSRKVRHEG